MHRTMLLIALIVLGSESLLGRSIVSVQKVTVVQTETQLLLKFRPYCGGAFKGISVSETDTQILLGAIYEGTSKQCLSLPETKTLDLSRLLRGKKPFASMPVKTIRQYSIIHAEHSFHHQGRLFSNYNQPCYQGVAQILYPEDADAIQISILGHRVKTPCISESTTITAEILSPQVRQVKPLPPLSRPYRMVLSPIRGKSIVKRGNETRFKYVRHCHDAPIGLVQHRGKFAVLVARYPASICPKQLGHRFLTTFKTHLFPGKIRPRNLWKAGGPQDFALVSPSSIKHHSNAIKIIANIGCSPYNGQVYREGQGRVNVSLLRPRKGSSCKTQPRKVSLSLPDRYLPAKVILPLRLI